MVDGTGKSLSRCHLLACAAVLLGAALMTSAAGQAQSANGFTKGPRQSADVAAKETLQPRALSTELLSDTRGVNFSPYLRQLLPMLYKAWLPLVPSEAQPPKNESGETVIRFRVKKDGELSGVHLDSSTHDSAMDRAAWGAITRASQFPPLPDAFAGPDLELRIRFKVNLRQDEAPALPWTSDTPSSSR